MVLNLAFLSLVSASDEVGKILNTGTDSSDCLVPRGQKTNREVARSQKWSLEIHNSLKSKHFINAVIFFPKHVVSSQADSFIQLQIEVDSQAFAWVAPILWFLLSFFFSF